MEVINLKGNENLVLSGKKSKKEVVAINGTTKVVFGFHSGTVKKGKIIK